MIKQLLNSVIAKYRDLSVSCRSIICLSLRLRQIIDLLATDKSRYFAQPRPIIVYYFVKYQPQDASDFLQCVYTWSVVFISLFLFTFTCWYSVVPQSRMLVARGNTRDCWRSIQTIANSTRKVTLCSIMIITAAHAQWTSWVYHLRQRRTVDDYNSERCGIKVIPQYCIAHPYCA